MLRVATGRTRADARATRRPHERALGARVFVRAVACAPSVGAFAGAAGAGACVSAAGASAGASAAGAGECDASIAGDITGVVVAGVGAEGVGLAVLGPAWRDRD